MQTSYVYHIQYPFFSFFLGMEGWGLEGLGACLDMLFSQILPETKSKPYSFQCTLVFFFPQRQKWREMCKSSTFSLERKEWKQCYLERDWLSLSLFRHMMEMFSTFHIPKGWLLFLYTSAFWLFSSTFSSSFFSSSEDPFSFSPVFQLPCLFRIKHGYPTCLYSFPLQSFV